MAAKVDQSLAKGTSRSLKRRGTARHTGSDAYAPAHTPAAGSRSISREQTVRSSRARQTRATTLSTFRGNTTSTLRVSHTLLLLGDLPRLDRLSARQLRARNRLRVRLAMSFSKTTSMTNSRNPTMTRMRVLPPVLDPHCFPAQGGR